MSNGVNGTVCTADEYALSIKSTSNPYPTKTCLTRDESIGLTVTAESAFISLISVLVLFGLILRNVGFYWRKWAPGTWRLLREPTDIYMLSLFFFDLIQALGGVFNIKWIHSGKVHTGSLCTTQGVFQQFGEVGVALATLAIAVHTFVVVFWRVGVHSRRVAFGVVAFIWVFVALWTGIGVGVNQTKNYITPSPYWCWIGRQFEREQIAGEYLWLWAALFFTLLTYIPLFFWSQGNLSVDPMTWWKFHVHRRESVEDFDGRKRRALGMLAYPAMYSLLVIPLSIARWRLFSGHPVPSAGTFVSIVVYNLSGFFNVLLLLTTRPTLLLFVPPPMPMDPPVQPIARGNLHLDREGGWELPSRRGSIAASVSTDVGREAK